MASGVNGLTYSADRVILCTATDSRLRNPTTPPTMATSLSIRPTAYQSIWITCPVNEGMPGHRTTRDDDRATDGLSDGRGLRVVAGVGPSTGDHVVDGLVHPGPVHLVPADPDEGHQDQDQQADAERGPGRQDDRQRDRGPEQRPDDQASCGNVNVRHVLSSPSSRPGRPGRTGAGCLGPGPPGPTAPR